jgi:hypothetical protein
MRRWVGTAHAQWDWLVTPIDRITNSITGIVLLMLVVAVLLGFISMWPALQAIAGA